MSQTSSTLRTTRPFYSISTSTRPGRHRKDIQHVSRIPLSDMFTEGQVDVAVEVLHQDLPKGTLVRMVDHRVVVSFGAWPSVDLPMGRVYPLQLHVHNICSVDTNALVLRRREKPHGREYTFEVPEPVQIIMPNRRMAYRVRPESPLQMVVMGQQGELEGEIIDLAISGLGVRLSEEAEMRLIDTDRCQVAFRVPGDKTILVFEAIIQHREWTPDGIKCGLSFSGGTSSGFHQGILQRYIMNQQRREARRTIT